MVFLLLSIIPAAIVVAISIFRHHISIGRLIRSEIARGDFRTARERAEQSSVAGPLKPFLIVVLPDGTIVTPRAAGQYQLKVYRPVDTVDPKIIERLAAIGQKFDEVFNSNSDAAALAALFTEDGVLVTPQGPIYGREAIEKHYAEVFKRFHISNSIGKWDQDPPQIHALGTAGEEFSRKASEIVGLYLNPPENAIVLSVDEKPSIQQLREAIDHFISAYNTQAAPFEWRQCEIKQQPLRDDIAYFCRSVLGHGC